MIEDLFLRNTGGNVNFSGQPGLGDAFFKHVHDHLYSTRHVERVSITPVDDESRSFAELPINTLDPSDRKFLAVAVASPAPILNATDSDWHDERVLISSLGVVVEQLCPQYKTRKKHPLRS